MLLIVVCVGGYVRCGCCCVDALLCCYDGLCVVVDCRDVLHDIRCMARGVCVVICVVVLCVDGMRAVVLFVSLLRACGVI